MIIKADASQLEWRSYINWSKDKVGIQEIVDGVDVHSNNQEAFNLPSRLIAKKFLFRWIYWGPAWAYANDNDFSKTSSSTAFWEKVIEKANEKYSTLYSFQEGVVRQATRNQIICTPTGREFKFSPKEKKDGSMGYNISDIVNHPNQGYAADLMIIARLSLYSKIKTIPKALLINTVHDDIQLDVDNDPELLYNISTYCRKAFQNIPALFEKIYKKKFLVPMDGEVSFGYDLGNLKVFDEKLGPEQFSTVN